jgi:hypothetical protein
MGKVILRVTMSLDGFITASDDSVEALLEGVHRPFRPGR